MGASSGSAGYPQCLPELRGRRSSEGTPLSFPRTMQSKVYLNVIFNVGASLTIVDPEGSGLERDPLRPQSHREAN